jgi:flavin-dependent dehydrogenase
MTDADLRRERAREDRLADAPATQSRLASWHQAGHAIVRPANSQCSELVAGEGWVAAGDTVTAFDPISAPGICFALRSGMEAAHLPMATLENRSIDISDPPCTLLRVGDILKLAIWGTTTDKLDSRLQMSKRRLNWT